MKLKNKICLFVFLVSIISILNSSFAAEAGKVHFRILEDDSFRYNPDVSLMGYLKIRDIKRRLNNNDVMNIRIYKRIEHPSERLDKKRYKELNDDMTLRELYNEVGENAVWVFYLE